jgi:hypothetical protein
MWDDRPNPATSEGPFAPHKMWSDTLRCDRKVWEAVTERMAQVGMNQIVIDVAEGLAYRSHPELAATGAWTASEMRDEIQRLKSMGIEAIPKLNFSASHDAWLNDYAHMVSSPTYYRVCAEVIAEVADVFGQPALFHIGMDEETAGHQRRQSKAVIRQHELWYHDLAFFAQQVEDAGCRPWMWADRIWHHRDEFLDKVPRSIVQSNWYYLDEFSFPEDEPGFTGEPQLSWIRVQTYRVLDEAGFDQVPCGGSYRTPTSMANTVRYCDQVIDESRLLGYMTAPWYATMPDKREQLLAAVDQVGEQIAQRGSAPTGR